MERVSDLGDVREGVVEGLAVRAGQVHHAEADRLTPRLGAVLAPTTGPGGAATSHDIEERCGRR
jgi:hypothetical protein